MLIVTRRNAVMSSVAECHIFIAMLSVIMTFVVMLSVIVVVPLR